MHFICIVCVFYCQCIIFDDNNVAGLIKNEISVAELMKNNIIDALFHFFRNEY